jgi:hypothetical protein
MEAGDRFTQKQAYDLEVYLKDWVEQRYPPPWLREDLTEIKSMVRDNATSISELKADVKVIKNNGDH